MPNRTLRIAEKNPLYHRVLRRLQARYELALNEHQNQCIKWEKAEDVTLAYIPETEVDSERRRRRDRGLPAYTTIQIPYTFALLMSAHTYWASVFFARSPIHQYVGRHGEGEQQIQAMEALINYQVDVGGHLGPNFVWLYDAGKYGIGILGSYWDKEKIHYGQIVESTDPLTGDVTFLQSTEEVEGYSGNRVYNVSPYDFLPDPRVPVVRFQEGEFCIVCKRLGWQQILRRASQGYYWDPNRLKGHEQQSRGRSDGSSQLRRPDFSKELFDDIDKTHPAGATLWECYVDLVPSEWGLGETSYPQKWVFTTSGDFEVLVGLSPLGYVHDKFPFDVLVHEVEGYGVYGRGIPETMEPIQDTMNWLLNSHFYNVRAALNNQFLLDPSKVVAKDTEDSGPGFIWRLRPEAYGSDLSKCFMQIPVTDVTKGNLQDLQMMLQIGERAIGINDQIMGAITTQGSSRRTATEVRATTGFGVNRLKTITEYMSATGFGPHSQKLVQSSQQYYDAPQKLRRVGSLAMEAGAQFLMVSPQDIMGYYDFINVDGTLPVDRMAQANLWKELMGSLRMMPPEVIMSYDWTRIFGWVASLAGLKNINQFKVEVAPDALLMAKAAAGGLIPMGGKGAGSLGGSPMGPGKKAFGGPQVEPGNAASTASGMEMLYPKGGALQ